MPKSRTLPWLPIVVAACSLPFLGCCGGLLLLAIFPAGKDRTESPVPASQPTPLITQADPIKVPAEGLPPKSEPAPAPVPGDPINPAYAQHEARILGEEKALEKLQAQVDIARESLRKATADKEKVHATPGPEHPAFTLTEEVITNTDNEHPFEGHLRLDDLDRKKEPSIKFTAPLPVVILPSPEPTADLIKVRVMATSNKGKEVYVRPSILPKNAKEDLQSYLAKMSKYHMAERELKEQQTLADNKHLLAQTALAQAESARNAQARTLAEARGVLQLIPKTLKEAKAKEEELVRKNEERIRSQEAANLAVAKLKKAEEEYDEDGLVLLRKTVEGRTGRFGGSITGTVENRRLRTVKYAKITFLLYDASNAQVGTAFDIISDLEPGARWKFKASIFRDCSRFKFHELTGR